MGPVKDKEASILIGANNNNGSLLKNGFQNQNGSTPSTATTTLPKVLPDILSQIGNTPMIRLNRIPKGEGVECEILAKCELFAPGGSHKDRIALKMIEEAERDGRLRPGGTIIEPTSGNTGIGVAMVAAVKGYRCIIVMPDKMSAEKHETMTALGAEVVRTPKTVLHTKVAAEIHSRTPNSLILDQYGNQMNPRVHYEDTAEEIISQCEGKLDMIVMGVGTGGVISGIGKKIKEKLPSCRVVGVDPEGSIMALPETINKTETSFWEVEGIGHDWIPDVLDRSVVDTWIKCNDKETFNMARRIIKEEGILVGGSCGATLAGAIKAIKQFNLGKGDRVVILLPDSVRNYMTKFLSDQWMHERGFLPDPPTAPLHSWWSTPISSLNLKVPSHLTPESTVNQALTLMTSQGLEQLPVISSDESHHLEGILTLSSLLKFIPSSDPSIKKESSLITPLISSQFKKLTISNTMGTLNYMLQGGGGGGNTVFIIQPLEGKKEKFIGIITALDFTKMITTTKNQ